MGRRLVTGGSDYDLKKQFAVDSDVYSLAASSALAAWIRLTPTAPTDLSSFGHSCQYDLSVSTSTEVVGPGGISRNIATFSDASGTNARVTPTAGQLSMSTAGSGNSGTASTDIPFSVAFWVKPTGISGAEDFLFGKESGSYEGMYTYGNGINGPYPVVFRLTATSASDFVQITYSEGIEKNEWHHIVMTYDGRGGTDARNGMKMYINGLLLSTLPTSNASYDGLDPLDNRPLYIGASDGGSNETTGDMSEFAIWKNYELSSSEAKSIYKASAYARATLITYNSGISSLPTRIQIRDQDQAFGLYPLNRRLGSQDSHRSRASLPYDDTVTQTFLSSFATAKIHINPNYPNGLIYPGTYVDITGSDGVTSHRFKFTMPDTPVSLTDIKVPIQTTDLSLTSEERIRDIAVRLSRAIKNKPDLKINVEHISPVLERLDHKGEKLETRRVRHTLVLKHKQPGVGSFDQGNRLNARRPNGPLGPAGAPLAGEADDTRGISVEQFKIGTTKPITLGILSAFDGGTETIISSGHSSPTISGNASMIPGITDAEYRPRQNYFLSPFDESRVPFSKDTNFDNQGTQSDVLEGFNTQLSSKTIISIKCKSANVVGDTIFYASGASGDTPAGTWTPSIAGKIGSGFAYWNSKLRQWEMKGLDLAREEITPFAAGVQNRKLSAVGFSLIPSHSLGYSTNFTFSSTNSSVNKDTINTLKSTSLPISTYGFPQAKQYNATGSQEILMSNHISSPFLLEKMKVEVKGIFGVATASLNPAFGLPVNKTFFVLNQRTSGDHPHTTGTFRVEGAIENATQTRIDQATRNRFDFRGNREIVGWGKIGFIREDNRLFTGPTKVEDMDGLFDDYDVLKTFSANDMPALTGTLNFNIEPRLAMSSDFVVGSTFKNDTGNLRRITQNNPLGGADLQGNASGRQIASSLGASLSIGTGSHDILDKKIEEKENNYKISPYLLLPKDRLILGWQNLMTLQTDISTRQGFGSREQGDLLVDRIQEVNITLYGSMIRNGKEFHDTLNQNLSSNEIHEVIFGEHIKDQFDLEPLSVLSGSTSDALFFGKPLSKTTTTLNSTVLKGHRGRRASIAKGEAGSTGSLQRNIGITSIGKFKDSLTPHLEFFLTNPTFFTSSATADSGLSQTLSIGNVPRNTIVLSNNPISSSFKLLKLVGIHQLVNPVGKRSFVENLRKSPASDFLTSPGAGKSTNASFLSFDVSTSGLAKYKVFSGTLDYAKGVKSFGSPEIATNPASAPPTLLQSKPQKLAISSLFFAAPIVSMFGKITWPVVPLGLSGMTPQIRGLRYGLSNTTPASPKAYFRRTSYGQFRDFMEQAPETAVIDLIDNNTGEVDLEAADGPVRIRFFARNGTPDIDPLDTNSQNLNMFATSSLPYYDGMLKERDIRNFPYPDDTDVTTIEEAVSSIIDGDA